MSRPKRYPSTVRILKSSRVHESFIKYNVRKTVNLFELDISLIKIQSQLEFRGHSLKSPIRRGSTRKGYHFQARVGSSLVEVYERIGKTVILVGKKAQKGLTDAFHIGSGAPNDNFRKISVRKTI